MLEEPDCGINNLPSALDMVYRASSRYIHDTKSFNRYLKQGGRTDLNSLRMAIFAIIILSIRGCGNAGGRVKKISPVSPGGHQVPTVCVYIAIQMKDISPEIPECWTMPEEMGNSANSVLPLSQVGETKWKILFTFFLEKYNQ